MAVVDSGPVGRVQERVPYYGDGSRRSTLDGVRRDRYPQLVTLAPSIGEKALEAVLEGTEVEGTVMTPLTTFEKDGEKPVLATVVALSTVGEQYPTAAGRGEMPMPPEADRQALERLSLAASALGAFSDATAPSGSLAGAMEAIHVTQIVQ